MTDTRIKMKTVMCAVCKHRHYKIGKVYVCDCRFNGREDACKLELLVDKNFINYPIIDSGGNRVGSWWEAK